MKKNKILIYFTMLIVFLCVSNFQIALADQIQDTKKLELYDYDDLKLFAENCVYDGYSKGLTVILMEDIDLSGTNFEGIPIFRGTFDGNDNSIKGLNINNQKDFQGFFRYLTTESVVKDLEVIGDINLGNNNGIAGGIAGENSGLIQNCSFSGNITGNFKLGSIAGVNTVSGKLIKVKSDGKINGETSIGGIVGENFGSIIQATNNTVVNETIDSTIDLEIVDIGGIAGVNTGIIQGCTNLSDIGYPHMGYNIGGIIGKQSGYVTNCTNKGNVYGRKDVGGIIGQMEPYSFTVYSESKLGQLQNELNILRNMITSLNLGINQDSELVNTSVSSLIDSVDNATADAEKLINQTQNIAEENLDQINILSVTISELIDRLVPLTDEMTKVAGHLTEVSRLLYLSLDELDSVLYELQGIDSDVDAIDVYVGQLSKEMDVVSAKTQDGLEDFQKAIDIATTGGAINVANLPQALIHLNDAAVDLQEASVALEKSINIMASIYSEISDIFDDLSDANYAARDTIEQFMVLAEELELLSYDFEDLTIELDSVVKWLSEQPDIYFIAPDDSYEILKSNLSLSLDSIFENLRKVNTTFTDFIQSFSSNFEQINQQLGIVSDNLFEIINEATGYDYLSPIVLEDISETTNNITAGKVLNSYNYGKIQGDISVGGIAGSISVEEVTDREDDFLGKTYADFTSTRKANAVIQKCHNDADIISKKDQVGGIAGNMTLGYISESTSIGTIKSTEGIYVGGIVGNSNAIVHKCYSKSNISGNEYLGGIAGFGYIVRDSYSMTFSNSDVGYSGAILGYYEDLELIENNYFLSENLSGIDEISYEGVAQPISYDDLKLQSSIFEKVTVDFFIEEQLIDTIEIDYNGDFPIENMPEVRIVNGKYGEWDEFQTENITMDIDVHAVYNKNIATLASEENIEETKPIILIEGVFDNNYVLNNKQIEIENFVGEAYTIDNPDLLIDKVRFLTSFEIDTLEILIDDAWEEAAFEIDGNYIVFDISDDIDDSITFRVVEKDMLSIKTIVTASVCILFFLIIILILKRKRSLNK